MPTIIHLDVPDKILSKHDGGMLPPIQYDFDYQGMTPLVQQLDGRKVSPTLAKSKIMAMSKQSKHMVSAS